MKRDIIFYEVKNGNLAEPVLFGAGGRKEDHLAPKEKRVAKWVLENNTHAGGPPQKIFDADCLYLSVRVGSEVFGVVGIAIGKKHSGFF